MNNLANELNNKKIVLREVTEDDAAALLEIYRPYVLETNITFEYEVPSEEEFQQRIRHTLENYPYLAAEADGRIVGYAYASAFKSRRAYDWSVETSIYIAGDCHGQGIGAMLYSRLEQLLAKQNICNLCACIAYPNPPSIAFHEKFGYRTVAHFTNSGYKAGEWVDMIWMEKHLSNHPIPPLPFIPFPQLTSSVS